MKSRLEIEQQLSLEIASALEATIRANGEASLLVSGGSTPVNLFNLLSEYKISWNKVTISLVDERFVTKDHKDLNENLVKEHLLKNDAAEANFVSLVLNESDIQENLQLVRKAVDLLSQPFTVVILGMGADGHTASLFPESPELDEGMNLNTTESLIITHPITASYERISFTRKALLNSKNLFLHCYGNDKKAILEKAKKLTDYRPYPIEGFIHQDKVKLEIFWTN